MGSHGNYSEFFSGSPGVEAASVFVRFRGRGYVGSRRVISRVRFSTGVLGAREEGRYVHEKLKLKLKLVTTPV